MPLVKFQRDDKWGIKNKSEKILLEPWYENVYLSRNGAVVTKKEYDFDENEQVLKIYVVDKSGDIIRTANEDINNNQKGCVLDIWPLNDYLFCFQYSDWDGLEVLGVFNDLGYLLVKPEYEEVEIHEFDLMTAFYRNTHNLYDTEGYHDYGWKLFDSIGRRLAIEPVKREPEKNEKGELIFTTEYDEKIIFDKFGNRIGKNIDYSL